MSELLTLKRFVDLEGRVRRIERHLSMEPVALEEGGTYAVPVGLTAPRVRQALPLPAMSSTASAAARVAGDPTANRSTAVNIDTGAAADTGADADAGADAHTATSAASPADASATADSLAAAWPVGATPSSADKPRDDIDEYVWAGKPFDAPAAGGTPAERAAPSTLIPAEQPSAGVGVRPHAPSVSAVAEESHTHASVPLPLPSTAGKAALPVGRIGQLMADQAARAVLPYQAPAQSTPRKDEHSQLEQWIGLNWTGWIGAIVLVIGAALGIKYAYDQGWLSGLPKEVRLGLCFTAGLGLLGIGEWIDRTINRISAACVFGAGIATLFVVSYAGFGYFELYAQSTAFVLMAISTFIGAGLAMRKNLVSIAVLSLLGGNLAPIILRTNEPRFAALLGYVLTLQLIALTLAAWGRGGKWWALRGLAVIMPALWVAVVYSQSADTLLPVVFTAIFAGLSQAELILAAGRGNKFQAGTAASMSILITSLLTLSLVYGLQADGRFTQGMAVLVIAGVCGALAFALWQHLEELSTAFRIQSAILVLVAVPVMLDGRAVVLAWGALSLAYAIAGRQLGSKYGRWFGAAAWAGAVLHLAQWFANDAAARRIVWIDLPHYFLLAAGLAAIGHALAWVVTRAPIALDRNAELNLNAATEVADSSDRITATTATPSILHAVAHVLGNEPAESATSVAAFGASHAAPSDSRAELTSAARANPSALRGVANVLGNEPAESATSVAAFDASQAVVTDSLLDQVIDLAAVAVFVVAAMNALPAWYATGAIAGYAWLLLFAGRTTGRVLWSILSAGMMLFALVKWGSADMLGSRLAPTFQARQYLPVMNPLMAVGTGLAGSIVAMYALQRRELDEWLDRRRVGSPAVWVATIVIGVMTFALSMEVDRVVGQTRFAGGSGWPWMQLELMGFSILWTAALAIHALLASKLAGAESDRRRWLAADRTVMAVLGVKFILLDVLGWWLLGSAARVTPIANLQVLAAVMVAGGLGLFWWLADRDGHSWRVGGAMILAIALLCGTVEIDRAFERTTFAVSFFDNARLAKQVAISIYWAMFAVGSVIAGFRLRIPGLRYFGLALLAVALGKVVLVDLQEVGRGYRILSFLALGGLLLATSVVYGKLSPKLMGEKETA